jgi:hypothetical protein
MQDGSLLFFRFQDRGNSVQPRTLFTEIISCISDVKFTGDGKYLLTRDYMNLKVFWIPLDMASKKVQVYRWRVIWMVGYWNLQCSWITSVNFAICSSGTCAWRAPLLQLTRCMSSFVLRYIIYPAQKHFTVLHRPVSCVSQNTTTQEVKNSFAAVGAVQQRLHFRQVQLLLQQGRGLLRHWILQVSTAATHQPHIWSIRLYC